MKVLLYVVGILLLLAGVVWILQGVNILPGSFMSGRIQYAGLGVVTGMLGAGLLIFANRRAKKG